MDMAKSTRFENRLVSTYEQFQKELRALRELHTYQEQRLYEEYRPRLTELAMQVGAYWSWQPEKYE